MLTAAREKVTFLGSLPFEPWVVRHADVGGMSVLDDEKSPFNLAFQEIADEIEKSLRMKVRAGKQKKLKEVS